AQDPVGVNIVKRLLPAGRPVNFDCFDLRDGTQSPMDPRIAGRQITGRGRNLRQPGLTARPANDPGTISKYVGGVPAKVQLEPMVPGWVAVFEQHDGPLIINRQQIDEAVVIEIDGRRTASHHAALRVPAQSRNQVHEFSARIAVKKADRLAELRTGSLNGL